MLNSGELTLGLGDALFKNKKPGPKDQAKYIGYALSCHSRALLSGIQNQHSPWIPDKSCPRMLLAGNVRE